MFLNNAEKCKEYRLKHIDRLKQYDIQRYKENQNGRRDKHLTLMKTEENRARNRNRMNGYRLLALKVLGGESPCCRRCGSTMIGTLEIHHKLYNSDYTTTLYTQIISGKRIINDLEILCKVCNYADFVERKFGVKYNVSVIEGDRPLCEDSHIWRS